MASILGILLGLALGQRFKVFALVPTLLIILLLAVGATAVGTKPVWSVGVSAAMAMVGLQLGYFLGAGIHYLKVVARANRLAQLRRGTFNRRDPQLTD